MPFRLDVTSDRFVESIIYYWTCVFLSVLYAIFAPLVYWNAIGSVMHPSTPLNNYMIVMQFAFMYAVVLLSRFEAITQCRKLMQLLNSILFLSEQTTSHTDVSSFEKRLTRKLWFKVIIFDVGMLIICGAFLNPMKQGRTLWSLMLGYGNMMLVGTMNMTVNFILMVLYRAEHIYRQINVRAGKIMQGTKTPIEIVKLYLQHTDTTVTVQCIIEILSIPVLLLNLWSSSSQSNT
ncbi:AGAP001171-PA-like protein [Anopheles sinensis]|uniref:AGAP001171-PA-like protein n=1 Tax=Anopheles sinensis TaxID=74873 RepID=A0A084W0H1_ANOSI|nr:AGAP001171-PA-like protein [Anopheles sinensis]